MRSEENGVNIFERPAFGLGSEEIEDNDRKRICADVDLF
jgi:hypothetical protein